jgi:hypothetical protein
MNAADILVLAGQVVQIVASFILSIEAIGLDRVARWIRSLSFLRSDLIDEKGKILPSYFLFGLKIGDIFLAAFLVGWSGVFFCLTIYFDKQLPFGMLTLLGLGAFFVVTLTLYIILHTLLGMIISALQYVDSLSSQKTSGILGFLLLFIGFVLQFVGTMGQSMFK